ncbi:hypothetical protein AAF712_008019 [Marasmius tenuissimus]|uniref:Uncharacterized protein n=1 Tax=Marasmius tenuissimus TaxID=585030 RepID=A0ABR2ZV98_9AGAR|nr:hypothetical protein PM082_012306 [Marasmius tenuissimus]
MKGEMLRATVSYLQFLISAPTTNTHRFFLNAGLSIPNDHTLGTDQIIEIAHEILNNALRVLQGWIREPENPNGNSRLLEMLLDKGIKPGLWIADGSATIDEVMDRNYHSDLIMRDKRCPKELVAAGIRALYELLKLSNGDLMVYSGEAQAMASILDDIIPFVHVNDAMETGKAIEVKTEETDDHNLWKGTIAGHGEGDGEGKIETHQLKRMMEGFRDFLKECRGVSNIQVTSTKTELA